MPQSLINQRIWDLGVDDPIWSDPALYAGGEDVPRWMYDTTFKAGIRAVLQLDRCSEESERLLSETEGFIRWVADRFDLLNQAWHESAGTLHADYSIIKCIEPLIDSPALQYQVTQRQIEHARVLDGCMYMQRVRLLQMWPVQQVLDRINSGLTITTAAPDVRGDLPDTEYDLVSDDDYVEGGEVESIPDEIDYAGNLYDEFETALAVQEQQAEAEEDLLFNESDPLIFEGDQAPLSGEIKASPSPPRNLFHPLPSPASSSPISSQFYPRSSAPSPPNALPVVPTPLPPPLRPSQDQHPQGGPQPSMVSDQRRHPSATLREPSRISGRFRLMGEVITEFNDPTRWMQGTMIQVFGEALCRVTHLHPERFRRVDILPSELPTMLERLKRGIEGDRLELETQIKQCLQPDECGMWFIPVCHKSHWWLIKIDWISKSVLVLDSFSSRGPHANDVLTLARTIIAKIHEVLEKPYVPWSSFSLDPVSPNVLRVSPSLNNINQRLPRQTNANDCGPHLAFDIACLAKTGKLSILEESSVPAWRTLILKQLRELPVYDPKQPRLTIRSEDVIDLT